MKTFSFNTLVYYELIPSHSLFVNHFLMNSVLRKHWYVISLKFHISSCLCGWLIRIFVFSCEINHHENLSIGLIIGALPHTLPVQLTGTAVPFVGIRFELWRNILEMPYNCNSISGLSERNFDIEFSCRNKAIMLLKYSMLLIASE